MFKYSVVAVINICMVLGFIAFNVAFGTSFGIAYCSTLLVVISSYYALQKRLARELSADTHTQHTPIESADQPQQKHHKHISVSKFMLGIQLSFGLYRLLSYIALGLCVIMLIDLGLFHIVGYIVGVLLCLLSVIFVRIFSSF